MTSERQPPNRRGFSFFSGVSRYVFGREVDDVDDPDEDRRRQTMIRNLRFSIASKNTEEVKRILRNDHHIVYKNADHFFDKDEIEEEADSAEAIEKLMVSMLDDADVPQSEKDEMLTLLSKPLLRFFLYPPADNIHVDTLAEWSERLADRTARSIEMQGMINEKSSERFVTFFLMLNFISHASSAICIIVVANRQYRTVFLNDEDNFSIAVVVWLTLVSVYFCGHELLQVYYQKTLYFVSFWNYFDIIRVMMLLVTCGFLLSPVQDQKTVLHLLLWSGFVIFVALVAFLRNTFLPFARFVGGVINMLVVLVPFFCIVLLVLLCFGYMQYTAQILQEMGNSNTPPDNGEVLGYLFNVYSLSIGGQLVDDTFSIENETGIWPTKVILSIIFVSIVSVLLINGVVVAVVTDAWETTSANAAELFWDFRLGFLANIIPLESMIFFRWMRDDLFWKNTVVNNPDVEEEGGKLRDNTGTQNLRPTWLVWRYIDAYGDIAITDCIDWTSDEFRHIRTWEDYKKAPNVCRSFQATWRYAGKFKPAKITKTVEDGIMLDEEQKPFSSIKLPQDETDRVTNFGPESRDRISQVTMDPPRSTKVIKFSPESRDCITQVSMDQATIMTVMSSKRPSDVMIRSYCVRAGVLIRTLLYIFGLFVLFFLGLGTFGLLWPTRFRRYFFGKNFSEPSRDPDIRHIRETMDDHYDGLRKKMDSALLHSRMEITAVNVEVEKTKMKLEELQDDVAEILAIVRELKKKQD